MGSKPPKYLVILFLTKFLFWFFCETPLFFEAQFYIEIMETFLILLKSFLISPTFDQAKKIK